MKNELTYYVFGDYLIPDIKLFFDTCVHLGKYRRSRRKFLQENAPILYDDLVLTEQLFPLLYEIDKIVQQRLELTQE